MFDFLSYIPLIGGTLTFVVPFLIVLSIVIFVHEYGHYIVGRWCGIHAEAFSMGFGPVLKSWYDKRGTKWQIAALPFGGYVKFLGDANAASGGADTAAIEAMPEDMRARTFEAAALWKRALTVFAGPGANFLLSMVVFGLIAMATGRPSADLVVGEVKSVPGDAIQLREGDLIRSFEGAPVTRWKDFDDFRDRKAEGLPVYGVTRDGVEMDVTGPYPWLPIVSSVQPGTAAAKAKLKRDDLVVSFDGKPMHSFFELQIAVQSMTEREVPIVVLRDGVLVERLITPRMTAYEKKDGSFGEGLRIGIGAGLSVSPTYETVGVLGAVQAGAGSVWHLAKVFVRTIVELVTGGLSVKNLQGPVGIAVASGDSASQGFSDFVFMIAFISTAIGLMNLLPIPILDGGHLVIFGYQAVFRRPPSERVLQVAMGIGLCMLLMLMIFATFNDIMRL